MTNHNRPTHRDLTPDEVKARPIFEAYLDEGYSMLDAAALLRRDHADLNLSEDYYSWLTD